MKNLVPPNDKNILMRLFFIPYILHMFKLIQPNHKKGPPFPLPRFEVFNSVKFSQPQSQNQNNSQESQKKNTRKLFFAICRTYLKEIILIAVASIFWTSLNLTVPIIVKKFYKLMNMVTLQSDQLNHATYITQLFIVLQILRTLASATTSRLSYQLSIKVQGSMGKQLVEKSLRLNQEVKRKLPQSQVYQLHTIDQAMVGKMFQNISSAIQIPLTLTVSIYLLFNTSLAHGLVGIFWIVVAFFLQSYFCQKLSQYSRSRIASMHSRAKFNFQMMQKMRQARLDRSQDILVQKNNDYFIKEIEDLRKFRQYRSLLSITLTLLPMVILLSIVFYDINSLRHNFKVQDVYNLLLLLIVAFKPLSNIQGIVVVLQQGLLSLNRIAMYLNLPNNTWMLNQETERDKKEPKLLIQEHTVSLLATKRHQKSVRLGGFSCEQRIQLQGGERLVVLGKKGQGTSIFLLTLLRQIKWQQGQIQLNGSLALCLQDNFFINSSIMKNIKFYDQAIDQSEVTSVCQQLGLLQDLDMRQGLSQTIVQGKFTASELKKIGLARVLCSKKKVYLLDCPFEGLSAQVCDKLQDILRKKQQQGVMIIITSKMMRYGELTDKIMILNQGKCKQHSKFEDMIKKQSSLIHKYNPINKLNITDVAKQLPIVRQFQDTIRRMLLMKTFTHSIKNRHKLPAQIKPILKAASRFSHHLYTLSKSKDPSKKQSLASRQLKYFIVLINQLSANQWVFSMLLILVSQLFGVLNKLQLGSHAKKQASIGTATIGNWLYYQLLFSVGLALLIYLQNSVISAMTKIIGNKVYDQTLTSAVRKPLEWYSNSDAPLIAHKFNHDFSQIDSVVSQILSIFRSLIIMATTIYLIDAPWYMIVGLTLLITLVYSYLLVFFRKVQQKVMDSLPTYKKQFTQIFNQIVEGALLINVFSKSINLLNKAQIGFINVSAYKMVTNNAKIIQGMLCELANTFIIAIGFKYGTQVSIIAGNHNQALVAVSVLLLFDLSDVLKKMVLSILKFQSQFRLKIYAYMDIMDLNPPNQVENCQIQKQYKICFKQAVLRLKNDPVFESYRLNLLIPQNQRLIIYESNQTLRNNIVLALTGDLKIQEEDMLTIGTKSIKNISKNDIRSTVAVISQNNFYFPGTLKQNISWKNQKYDQNFALKLAKEINIKQELPTFQEQGFEMQLPLSSVNPQLTRKIAFLKAILRRPKVLILKDTPWIIGGRWITDILDQFNIQCTVIGICSDLMGCKGAWRIVFLQNLQLKEDVLIQDALNDHQSYSGLLLNRFSYHNRGMWPSEKKVRQSQLFKPQSTTVDMTEELEELGIKLE